VRTLIAGLLLLVGALLVPVTTAAWWLNHSVVPEDGYVETVTPLATDPAVTAEVEKQLSTAMVNGLNGSGVLDRFPRLHAGVQQLTDKVAKAVVENPEFESAWIAANRAAHRQLIAVLENDPKAVQATGENGVDIKIATLTRALRQELENAGVPLASKLPDVQATFPVSDTQHLKQAQRAYSLLEQWGGVLPFVTVVLIVLGLVIARRRARALGWTAAIALLGLALTFFALVAGKQYYLGSVPTTVSQDAANSFFDTMTAGLRHDLLWVAIVCVIALVVAVVLGVLTTRRREAPPPLVG
jgi:hypothetical protein